MNLGQLIGAYWNALDASPSEVLAGRLPEMRPLPTPGRKPRTGGTAKIRAALVAAGEAGLTISELAAATELRNDKATSLVTMMPDAEHIGERGAYRYRLKRGG